MGRVVLGVLVWTSVTRAAAEDTDPTPRPAPTEINWYANTAPANTNTVISPRRIRVNRGGVFALGGVARTDGEWFARLDLGMPTPTRKFQHLRALVVIEARYDTDGSGMQKTSTSDLAVTPQLQTDRRVLGGRRGGWFLGLGLGLERTEHWIRLPDEPFWPSRWESSTLYAVRAELALQFRGRNGLVISLQPISAALPLNTPDPPDARFMPETPTTRYGLSLTAGYQLP
jgi:hypothetical protein